MDGIKPVVSENTYVKDLQSRTVKEEPEGDKTDFMKLMIAQLQNQNPLDPKDGGEFLSQLAQFTQVEGVTKINEQLADMTNRFNSSQALQASALVGRSVRVETGDGYYTPGKPITGVAELTSSSTNIFMTVTNASGALVNQVKLPTSAGGDIPLSWDGKNAAGEPVFGGKYKISVKAEEGGEMVDLKIHLDSNVNSVTVGGNGGLTLNLAGGDAMPLNQVTQIK